MSKTRTIFAALAAGLALAAPGVGLGQSTPQAAPAAGQPVMYGADAGEYTADGFSLRGRAEVLQGENRLRAERISGFTEGGDLKRVEASGEVYFVTPGETIRGERAVYDLTTGDVTVTGEVILSQGRNVLTGSRLVYNVRSQTARMDGAPRGAAGNRVQGVLYPRAGG